MTDDATMIEIEMLRDAALNYLAGLERLCDPRLPFEVVDAEMMPVDGSFRRNQKIFIGKGTDAGRRVNAYCIPDLQACRDAFSEMFTQKERTPNE